jgi:hypothetical protein
LKARKQESRWCEKKEKRNRKQITGVKLKIGIRAMFIIINFNNANKNT